MKYMIVLLISTVLMLAMNIDTVYAADQKILYRDILISQGVIIGQGVTDKMMETYYNYYVMVPQYIRNYIQATGGVNYLDVDGRRTGGHAGQCNMYEYFDNNSYFGTSEIAVNGSSPAKIQMAVIHEMGHHVDHTLGMDTGTWVPGQKWHYLSSNPSFLAIYKAEAKKSGFESWATDCPEDYFAEAFRFYFENPMRLNDVPGTYVFIQNAINMITNIQ